MYVGEEGREVWGEKGKDPLSEAARQSTEDPVRMISGNCYLERAVLGEWGTAKISFR